MKKIFLIILALFVFAACGGGDPEAEAVQGAEGGNCYPNKTCDDGLECSEDNNICVKKDSNGDSDNPADHDSDDDSGDSENSSDNDSSENNDSSDSVSDNDSIENESECGNGTKEAGEICEKGDYVTCSEVNSEYSASNFATCNDYCNGWNTDKCEDSQGGVQPLASFPAAPFELDYLYNGLSAYEAAGNQLHELWQDALFHAAITMEGGTYSIPNPQANVHWIAAYYDSSVLSFYQNSYFCDDEMNCQFATPAVIFGAALSELKAGKELSIGISDDNQVNMLIEDVMTTNSEQDCVMLVGYGTLKVDSVNISAGEAGNFKFTTSKIGLYLPAVTPEGDMSGELKNAGFKICE